MLGEAIRLHCLSLVRNQLGWYLKEGVISRQAAAEIEPEYQESIQKVLVNTNDWIEAFDIVPHKHLHTPIERDYVTYAGQNDPANLSAAGDLFDGRTAKL